MADATATTATTATANTKITLRPPTTAALPQPTSFAHPAIDWLAGTWHVTHSTLPMWASKRNVSITYKPHAAAASPEKLDDIVSYQTRKSDKVKTVIGVDSIGGNTGTWDWRGKGWLVIASSHWEVLGSGDLDGDHRWAVTYFAKTLFTPAGIDVYSRKKEGLPPDTIRHIKGALAAIGDDGVAKLAGQLFEVKRD